MPPAQPCGWANQRGWKNMAESKDINTISVAKFRRIGYLQEINRTYLHPMGLALSVEVGRSGEETFGIIWDYRDDLEGIVFDDSLIDDEFEERANLLAAVFLARSRRRKELLGYIIQPIKKGERDD
jgi:hypothetical protein